MQRTSSGGVFSIAASCFRRLCVACEALQHVILLSLISTTAQDGPIEPCVWMAKSYVAEMRFGASLSALALLPTLEVTSSLLILVARTYSQSCARSGSPSHFDQVAFSLRAA